MKNSRLIKVLGALFALSLLAAACGDDDDSASDTTTEDTSTDTTEEETTTESTESESTVPEDTSTICDAEALTQAVEAGPDAGTLEGMTEDPVATAASNNPVLTQTAMAVDAAGLVDTLNNAEDITVFAPTDCAFAEAPQETIDMALADPTGLLANVLQFHVVDGTFSAEDLASQSEALPTLLGQELSVSTEGEDVVLNDGMATVQVPDIETANATVHLIDSVMLPPEG